MINKTLKGDEAVKEAPAMANAESVKGGILEPRHKGKDGNGKKTAFTKPRQKSGGRQWREAPYPSGTGRASGSAAGNAGGGYVGYRRRGERRRSRGRRSLIWEQ